MQKVNVYPANIGVLSNLALKYSWDWSGWLFNHNVKPSFVYWESIMAQIDSDSADFIFNKLSSFRCDIIEQQKKTR